MVYITIILGFLATCFALRGKTWDESAKSWRRLTPVGWAVLTIAVAATSIALYKSHSDRTLAVERFRSLLRNARMVVTSEDVVIALKAKKQSINIMEEKVADFRRGFAEVADSLDQWRQAHKDALSVSEAEAIVVASNSLRRAPDDVDQSRWISFGESLDEDFAPLENSFCRPDPLQMCPEKGEMKDILRSAFQR